MKRLIYVLKIKINFSKFTNNAMIKQSLIMNGLLKKAKRDAIFSETGGNNFI